MAAPAEGVGASISEESAELFSRFISDLAGDAAAATHGLATVAHTISLANKDSTDVRASEWISLVSTIERHYDEYAGFLVCMGTNTLAYASSALSFALRTIGKPVVVTGAQVPAEKPWSDARTNIVNSLRWLSVACDKSYAGVYVVFGSQIIWGSRAKKLGESGMDAFASFNTSPVGEFGPGITLFEDLRPSSTQVFTAENGFDERVLCVTLMPGLHADALQKLLALGDTRGFILRSFGSGDIPHYLFGFLEQAASTGVPVVNTTQCPKGKTLMGMNDMGKEAQALGVIPAYDMSMEAMSTKLMWLLARGRGLQHIREEMTKCYAKELNASLIEQTRYYLEYGVQAVGRRPE